MRARDLLMLALAAAGVLAYRDATSTPAAPPPAATIVVPPPTMPGGTAQLPAPRTGRALVANLLGDSLLRGPCTRCVDEVDVLVVTLPDPVRSTLDWAYDAGLEAVHRAHEQAGFVLDRFYLPWSVAPGARPADAASPVEPGVLLFRSTSADTLRLRLVYLVGELPTSGIHKDALHAAVRDAAGIVRDLGAAYGAEHRSGPLRVVGPALSGSSFSIAVALRGALADDSVRQVWRDAAVVTGTATSRSNREVLTWNDSLTSSSFAAMVYPDETLGRFQESVLQRTLGFAPEDIAMLRESNTTYGRAAADGAAALAPDEGEAAGLLQVPFSMSIAVLRGELSRRATGRPLPTVPLGGEQGEERVALDLTPTGVTTDHPAVTSRLAAPLMDWMLDEIAQNLAAHRVRAVGIMATDSRDVLFLGSELRQRFRDVQLFTYGASGLFARADRSEWLQGMLVVSNYPLNMETQWWTGSRVPPSLLAFGSEIGVGVYNATLAQLGADDWMVDARSPFRAGRPPPYWVMAVGRGTILPVAVVTEPLDTLYRPALAAAAGAGAPGLVRPARTRGITQPFLFFAAGIVILWSLVMLERRDHAEPHRPISPRTFRWLLGGWSGSLVWGPERQHAQYATLRFAAVTALAIPAGLILAHRARHAEHRLAAVVLLLSLLLFAGAVLFALYTAWQSFEVGQRRMQANTAELPTTGETPQAVPARRADPEPGEQRVPPLHRAAESGAIVISIGLSALFVVLAAVLTAQIVSRSLTGPDARLWEELFFTRATALGSGLSPFLPFLALAGIVTAWATWHLYRVRRLRAVPTFEPAQRLAEDGDFRHVRACARDLTSGGIPESIRAIRLRLTSLAVDRWGAAMLLVMIGLSVWLLPEFTFTFERMVLPALPFMRGRGAFDVLLTFGILASIWIILVGLYRLVTVWAALRRLLGELASTRLLDAFRRLPAPVARLTRLTPWDIPSDDVIHSAIGEEWRDLERLSAAAGEKLPAGGTSECGRGIASRSITAPALDDLVEARRRGASLLLLLRHLHRAWDEIPPPDRPGPDGKPAPRTEVQQWLGQLEECVAVYVVDYVEWVLGYLRHLAAFVVTAVVLSVVLVSSYPFRPQALVKAIVFALLVATAAVLLIVLWQLNRDELASNIQKTDVGRVTWDLGFLLNISLFVLVPLLTLVSAGVPEVREFLFSWVTPTLRTFSGG